MGTVRASAVAQRAYEYYQQRPNEALFSSAVANELGLNVGSVQSTIARLAATPDANIKKVFRNDMQVRGLYVYRTNGGDVADQTPEVKQPRTSDAEAPFQVPEAEAVAEMDAVSAYPAERSEVLERAAKADKLLTNSGYGTRIGAQLYEFIGETKAGAPIVRDESGKLWTLREL